MFMVDHVENGQVLYETRFDVEDAEVFLSRLLRDDQVTEIRILKTGTGPARFRQVNRS